MKRATIILCSLCAASVVFRMFPLFHVVRLDEAKAEARRSEFSAPNFVATFWTDRLLPSLKTAADAETVLAEIERDPQSALKAFGRKAGMGRTTLLVMRGTGAVVGTDAKGVSLSLAGAEAQPDIVLSAGLLFGNVVRDATGLLNPSDFENSQQFNEISTELNRHIETNVMPILKTKASTGRQVRFVGCVEVPDDRTPARPITLIPLVVSVN